MAEPTVRCWQCGARIPERRSVRHAGADLCPPCNGARLDNWRKWLAIILGVMALAVLAVVTVVGLTLVAASYLLFGGQGQ